MKLAVGLALFASVSLAGCSHPIPATPVPVKTTTTTPPKPPRQLTPIETALKQAGFQETASREARQNKGGSDSDWTKDRITYTVGRNNKVLRLYVTFDSSQGGNRPNLDCSLYLVHVPTSEYANYAKGLEKKSHAELLQGGCIPY